MSGANSSFCSLPFLRSIAYSCCSANTCRMNSMNTQGAKRGQLVSYTPVEGRLHLPFLSTWGAGGVGRLQVETGELMYRPLGARSSYASPPSQNRPLEGRRAHPAVAAVIHSCWGRKEMISFRSAVSLPCHGHPPKQEHCTWHQAPQVAHLRVPPGTRY